MTTPKAPADELFRVMLPWSDDGDPSADGGTYASFAWAKDEEDAIRKVATEMADHEDATIDGENERKLFIDNRCTGWSDVSNVRAQLSVDLGVLFAKDLFPGESPGGSPEGGIQQIDMEALRELMIANRDRLILAEQPKIGVRP